MNKDTPIPSSVRLERGKIETVTLNSGGTARVKVRFLPARHLNHYLDLRDSGNEASLLLYVLERDIAYDPHSSADSTPLPPVWAPVGGKISDGLKAEELKTALEANGDRALAFIDDLDDESVARLIGVADWLNLFRAVSQAERQIETGNALLSIRKRTAATMIAPIEESLRSLTQSLITQMSSAAEKKQP